MKTKLIFTLLLLISKAFAQQVFVLDSLQNEVKVRTHFLFLEDKKQQFSEKDIGEIAFENQFQKSSKTIPSLGYSNSILWAKFKVKNISEADWLLELDNPNIDEVTLYLLDNQQLISKIQLGDNQPITTYPIQDRNPIFPLKLQKNKDYTIYLKGKSSEELTFKLTFWQSKSLYKHLAERNLFWGIFFGFIIVIALYNFFLWLTIRDSTYLYYILYVLAFGFFQFSLYGFGYQYIWGNSLFNEKAHAIFVGASITFLTLFSFRFLDFFKNVPSARKPFRIIGIFWFILYFFLVFTFSHRSVIILMSVSVFGLIFQYYYSIKLLQKGNQAIRFYLLAVVAFTIAIVIILVKTFINIPGDFYLKIGSMIEMVLFSVALGDKYREIEKDRIRQQKIRDEIASNLHDDLAASLSSLTMFSESNRRKAQKENAQNAEIFKRISDKSREILNQVRENVWEMNPRNDQSDEWFDRMIKFANETLESRQIDLELDIDPKIQHQIIPIDIRHDLYLFFKEVVNNIAKHSEANLVKIQILLQHNHFEMKIEDNGKGFNINELQKGNGLINLKKRADNINGKYKIESEPNVGTSIYLSFRLIPKTIH